MAEGTVALRESPICPRAVPLLALLALPGFAVVGVESSSSKMSETESVTAGLFIDSPNERRMSQPPVALKAERICCNLQD